MKVHIGIGQELSFYVLSQHRGSLGTTCYVERSTDPEMFIWLTQYLLDQGHDPTKEHKWYEIEL